MVQAQGFILSSSAVRFLRVLNYPAGFYLLAHHPPVPFLDFSERLLPGVMGRVAQTRFQAPYWCRKLLAFLLCYVSSTLPA